MSELKSEDRNDKSIYHVASKSVGVRVQKAVDPEVAALLDDSDLSRFGSDVEDLEEDFVVRANLPEGEDDLDAGDLVEGSKVINEGINEYVNDGRENVVDRSGVEKAINAPVEVRGDFGDEKQRVRRPLDEQFDLVRLFLPSSLFLIMFFIFILTRSFLNLIFKHIVHKIIFCFMLYVCNARETSNRNCLTCYFLNIIWDIILLRLA